MRDRKRETERERKIKRTEKKQGREKLHFTAAILSARAKFSAPSKERRSDGIFMRVKAGPMKSI